MKRSAELAPRIVAALIDALIGWVVVVIPILGGIVSVLYLLLKDGIMFQLLKTDEWKNKSIGKKIMNIEVETADGSPVDLALSAKRNIPLSIGSFLAIIPVIGWIFGPMVAMIFAVIEIVLVLTDSERRRLGDKWANTRVVQSEPVVAEENKL